MNKFKNCKGITILALVVVFIVIIIITSVSISFALGKEGTIGKTLYAKDANVISKEREQVNFAYSTAYAKKKGQKFEVNDLQKELDNLTSDNKTIVSDLGNDKYNILYKDTNHNYIVNDGFSSDNLNEKNNNKGIYAKLYTDGTLILSSIDYYDSSRIVKEDYGNISDIDYSTNYFPKWIVNNGGSVESKASNVILLDNIQPIDTSYWFYGLMDRKIDLSKLDTSKDENMKEMFGGCKKLETLDFSNFNTDNVKNMSSMFTGCEKLNNLDLSTWNTSNVTDTNNMFYDCKKLESLDLSNFNTSNITDMSSMFQGCKKLESINLSNWNTSNVLNMSYMFDKTIQMYNIDISSFDISNSTITDNMFTNLKKINIYVKNSNIKNILHNKFKCNFVIK